MQVLIVSNMRPDSAAPGRGQFVRDQVAALRALPDLDVELVELSPGLPALAAAPLALRRRARRRVDVVHAHFGLTAWPALTVSATHRVLTVHGTDVRHPRTRRLTRAVLPRLDLVAAVSASLRADLPPGARRTAVLPCGVDLARFRPLDRAGARRELGLPPHEPCLLFPADPARAGKRFDLAQRVAGATRLLTAGAIAPEEMPLHINAANAVLVPSDAEGFGLAVLEALACEVPVLATAVGIHPLALEGVAGCLCAPFEARTWADALAPHLLAADPRVDGRSRAELFSAARMAERVAAAYRDLATP